MIQTLRNYLLRFASPALLLAVLGQVAVLFFWSGSVDSRVSAVEDRQDRQGSQISQQSKDEEDIKNLQDTVNRIDGNVQSLVQVLIKQNTH